ncbi:alpha-6-galactosyltransferase [Iris pallida]|uniref:Alpha-6-galactosyltransferase n=1 Tax=Iris pallida TaxID=29817 RepID=A0AAX6F406_IRIPA|nr:alpha-6-galactosyltransferase [Iris pallida]
MANTSYKCSLLSDGLLFASGAGVALLLFFAFYSFFSPSPPPSNYFHRQPLRQTITNTNTTSSSSSQQHCYFHTSTPPLNTDPAPSFYDDPSLSLHSPGGAHQELGREAAPLAAPAPHAGPGPATGLSWSPVRSPAPAGTPWGTTSSCASTRTRPTTAESTASTSSTTPLSCSPTFLLLGPDPRRPCRHGRPPRSRMDLVGRLRRRVHRHGVRASDGEVRGLQSGAARVAAQGRGQELDQPQRGVFLIRNCQWSVDFIDRWARMGPQSPEYRRWGRIQKALFKDKLYAESDDQTGIIYLLLKEKERWGDKIYLENDYYFEGYWVG